MNKKHILKQAFKTYFPDQFLEKSKRGFAIPVGDWLRTILRTELLDFINLKFSRASHSKCSCNLISQWAFRCSLT